MLRANARAGGLRGASRRSGSGCCCMAAGRACWPAGHDRHAGGVGAVRRPGLPADPAAFRGVQHCADNGFGAAERVQRMLETAPAITSPAVLLALPQVYGALELGEVWFKHEPGDRGLKMPRIAERCHLSSQFQSQIRGACGVC